MKNYRFIRIIFLTTLLFLSSFSLSFASSTGIDINLDVAGVCNNNGICESGTEDVFNCPADCVTPPTSGQTTGSIIVDFFKNLTVEVSYNSAIIRWESSIPTISNVKWGTNPDYKDGVLSNVNFLLHHQAEITNLKDGTLYYFNIQAESLLRKTNSLENQMFRTLSLSDTTPPGNPTNVIATSGIPGITISWKNPIEEDFDYIRVMRNTERFFSNPFTGHLVYEGSGQYFTDSNVKASVKYFYSLFSRDRAGNYSSGSLVSIVHNPLGLDTWGEELTPAVKIEPLSDIFIVTQCSSTHDFYPGNVFSLSGDLPINIKTNYSSKIKNDDMWVEIRNKEGVSISQYFFSRERDKDGFINIIIPSFPKEGYYHFTIYKYNNKATEIVNYGALEITKFEREKSCFFLWYILCFIIILIALFIILILFLLFFVILPTLFDSFRKI